MRAEPGCGTAAPTSVPESERNLQEPQRRPTFASRSALVDEVFVIVLNRVKDALVPVLADYFVRLGVAAVASPESHTSAAATRADLHRALADFARSSRCPPILRYVIPGLAGKQFAAQPPHPVRDKNAAFERLEAEQEQHVASLADFGEHALELHRSISLCLFMLMPDPADYPKPSAMASALRLGAALEEDLHQLGEQSASMSDVEKLSAFRERLRKLRWKHTYCEGGWRPPGAPLIPHPGIRIGGNGQASSDDDEDPEPPPPDAAAEELLAWEHEAGKQWLDAHGVMWLEVVLPVVQSCRDVAELAQQHSAGEELIALAVTTSRELWQHPIVAPKQATLKALEDLEAKMDLLWVRVTEAAKLRTAGARASWPPPEHPTVTWGSLKAMEQHVVRVFMAAGKTVSLEVPLIALKARGVEKPTRHDYQAASRLEELGILEKPATRTGRVLLALPRGMPPLNAEGAAEV